MDRITPEPWLRGTIQDVHPVIAQLLYSFQQTWEDLEYFTAGLTHEQLWAKPHGLTSVGSQIRHIIGSIDRLLTYARGEQLTSAQLAELKSEAEPRDNLLATVRTHLADFDKQVREFDPQTLDQPRKVGRKELSTTVGGLLVHIAEHTQRHVGQAIITAKVVKATH